MENTMTFKNLTTLNFLPLNEDFSPAQIELLKTFDFHFHVSEKNNVVHNVTFGSWVDSLTSMEKKKLKNTIRMVMKWSCFMARWDFSRVFVALG